MRTIRMAETSKLSGLTSYMTELECSGCGARYKAGEVHTFCRECQSPLLTRYDLPTIRSRTDRDAITARPAGMWRWRELLPVQDEANIVTLGEGDAPLLHVPRVGNEFGLHNIFVKDE